MTSGMAVNCLAALRSARRIAASTTIPAHVPKNEKVRAIRQNGRAAQRRYQRHSWAFEQNNKEN